MTDQSLLMTALGGYDNKISCFNLKTYGFLKTVWSDQHLRLYLAICTNNKEAVESLVPELDKIDIGLLFHACDHKHLNIISLMVNRLAHVAMANQTQQAYLHMYSSLLFYCVESESKNLAISLALMGYSTPPYETFINNMLIAYCGKITSSLITTPLHLDFLETLVRLGATKWNEAFFSACFYGNVNILHYLFIRGQININTALTQFQNCLFWCIRKGHLEAIEYMVQEMNIPADLGQMFSEATIFEQPVVGILLIRLGYRGKIDKCIGFVYQDLVLLYNQGLLLDNMLGAKYKLVMRGYLMWHKKAKHRLLKTFCSDIANIIIQYC